MNVGTPVKTAAYLTVYSAAGSISTQGHQQAGATGAINGGPTTVSGVVWWKVNFTLAPDGWVQEAKLIDTSLMPPVCTAAPVISGDALVGGTLTLAPGAWTGNPAPTIFAQWMADGVDTLAAGLTYGVLPGDEGKTFVVSETGSNSQGSVAAPSNSIGPMVLPQPAGLFIRPVAYGLGDGSSWDNAGSLAQLGAFIAAVPVGETVFIRADEGPYLSAPATTVSRGDGLIYVQGVNADYSFGMPRIEGNRTEWTLPADPEQVTSGVQNWTLGGNFIRFADGAAHICFYDLDLHRFGDVFYNTAANTYLDDIVILNCNGYNVRRFFEQATSVKGCTNVTIEDVTVIGFSKTCIRFQNDSHDCHCINVHVNSGRQNGDNFAMGFQCESAVVPSHHITFDNCVAENCHSTSGGDTGYAQGDGFVAEYGCHDITWTDCISRGNTDGGWDIKGHGHKLTRCIGEDNKRNVRNWGLDTKLDGCKLRKAHKRYGGGSQRELWCGSTSGMVTAGTYAQITLDADPETGQHCVIEASAETALAEKDKGGLRLNNTDITKPAATELCFSASSGGGSFSMDAYTTAHVVHV